MLLERGTEIDASDVEKQTPLYLSALCNSTEVAQLLLERGAEIDARNVENQSHLELARINPRNEAVKRLLMELVANAS